MTETWLTDRRTHRQTDTRKDRIAISISRVSALTRHKKLNAELKISDSVQYGNKIHYFVCSYAGRGYRKHTYILTHGKSNLPYEDCCMVGSWTTKLLSHSTVFKVIENGAIRQILFVFYCNDGHVLYSFRDKARYVSTNVIFSYPLPFNLHDHLESGLWILFQNFNTNCPNPIAILLKL